MVTALYSRQLQAGTELVARTTWGRFILREDGRAFQPGDSPALGDLGMGEVHEVPAPMHLLQLPDDRRRRGILDFLHEQMLTLADARGWESAPLQNAYECVIESGIDYRLVGPAKSSPDRKHRATLSMTIDGVGDAWLTVTIDDRSGDVIYAGPPIATDETERNFNAAKRSVRWLDNRRVRVEPWPIEPMIKPLPDWTQPQVIELP